jgi:hypothetical protein
MLVDSIFYSTLLCFAALALKRLCWYGKPTPILWIGYVFLLHFILFFGTMGSQSGEWSRAIVMMLGTIAAIAAYLHLSGDVAYYRARYPKPQPTPERIRGPEDHPNWSQYRP